MTKILKKLKSPSIDIKPETKFLNEIHDGTFKTNKVNNEYLKSFRDERKIRESHDWITGIAMFALGFVITLLILSAFAKQNDVTMQNSKQFYSLINK